MPVRERPITLADLASHTSGLPRLPKGFFRIALRERANPYATYTVDQLHAAIARTKPRRAPGKKIKYSNYGAGLLGHVLALRAGKSYEELVAERITGPLEHDGHRASRSRPRSSPGSPRDTTGGAGPFRTGTSRPSQAPARCARRPSTCSASSTPSSAPRRPASRRRSARPTSRARAGEASRSGSAG